MKHRNRVIGQIVCPVVGSFGGVGVSGLGVEFVPVDAGAVSHGDAVGLPRALRARLPRVLVKFLDPLVGGRVPGGPRGGLGMFGPVAAPPADRLDPANQPQSAVPAEHVANARVPRLDRVVRRRNWLDAAPGRPQERERVALPDAPAQHASRRSHERVEDAPHDQFLH